MRWDNWFSYGEDNFIPFTDEKVLQITGKNGSGKSSIPVILGEVLYSKNAVGKTKQKLVNRYLDSQYLSAEVEFTKDGKDYRVEFSRKSTLKLRLFEDGEDISSHTTTNTYKTLERILGFDFKTFWQLIYQSSKEGLDFLTATDTNRKKFLVNLFNLNSYLDIHENFKKHASKINNELLELNGKISSTSAWIVKHEKEDFTIHDLKEVPVIDQAKVDKISDLKAELLNINETNRKINLNNEYRKLLNSLDTSILNEEINVPSNKKELEAQKHDLWTKINTSSTQINNNIQFINKIEKLGDKCPTCEQPIDPAFVSDLITISREVIDEAEADEKGYNKKIKSIDEKLLDILKLEKRNKVKESVAQELQDLLSRFDKTLPAEIIVPEDIQNNIDELNLELNNINTEIRKANEHNIKAEQHNTKVGIIEQQLIDYKKQLKLYELDHAEREDIYNRLNIIKKAFSTNGLVNYKIDYLIKDLEFQINSYLEELSSGKFQLNFTLKGEKLNIDILDDDKTITIEELSAGELARVNTATLLAIRKLMAAISSTKLNVLFLDEITGVLDDEGKEKLIEILMKEDELNTFLVSHEYDHPLIPKMNIVKENKISRIEE
jgi:DNA repair exonuclease SbcCD ATPase subunit